MYIVLSSSSFVDELSSANAIDASLRRGDGEGGGGASGLKIGLVEIDEFR